MLDTRYELAEYCKGRSEILNRKVKVIEIGLGFGDFSTYLLKSAGKNIKLISVESWKGRYRRTKMRKVRNLVLDRMSKYLLNKHYSFEVIEKDSADACNEFGNNTIDVVYIDGDHSYDGVKADIENWYPKVIYGGLFGGHDYKKIGVRGVRDAVNEFVLEHNLYVHITEDYSTNPSWFVIKK